MRNEIDVTKALTLLLMDNFSTITVTDQDIEEGFDRPCFYIDIVNTESGNVGEFDESTMQFSIYYFCKNINTGYLELLNMKNNLLPILKKPVKISEDFYFTCDNLSFVINKADKVLTVNFDVELIQEEEKDTEKDYMDNLIINEEEA